MKRANLFIFCLLTLFIFFGAKNGSAQCSNSIQLTKIEKPSHNGGDGSINVDVKSTTSFTATLVKYQGTDPIIIESSKGAHSQRVKFSNLATGIAYQIIVEFENEKDFLCKKKVIETVILKD